MPSISTGMILWIYPEKIGMNRNEMFRSAVDSISPSGNESLQANLIFFIDRGYLEIAKNQNVENVSNMVQLMLYLGVKFLGTLKNTPVFLFRLEDLNYKRMTNHNNKVVAQCYGTRNFFIARIKIGGSLLKAAVLRHGMGRVRAARLSTNMPLLLVSNTWVYETTSGYMGSGEVKIIIHFLH